jgi:MoxR-like ATPase
VPEWPIGTALKAVVGRPTAGSNPAPSASPDRQRAGSRPPTGSRRATGVTGPSACDARPVPPAAGPVAPSPWFTSPDDARSRLRAVGYLPDAATALTAYLAGALEKPLLVEGPAGVGKTELARAVSRATGAGLVRLQCYEGLDEARALYEWNYKKQLLRIQAGAGDEAWSETHDDVFSEEFLLTRPLLTAIRREEPTVLLVDEVDKTDVEVEGLLLEVLGDFQVTIPELGTVAAVRRPLVVLTSNATRELSEALKRRCLYLHVDYPDAEREREIVTAQVPDVDDRVADRLVEVVQRLRELELKKAPSIAESVDWARTLVALQVGDLDEAAVARTLGVVLKHASDHDRAARELRLAGAAAAR